MGNVDEQQVAAEEIRPQDGLLDICEQEVVHYTEAWQCQFNVSRSKCSNGSTISSQQIDGCGELHLGGGRRVDGHIRSTIHQESTLAPLTKD